MDIKAYVSRIGYTGSLEANKETLFALQEAHLWSVPFENLDIHYGKEILLDSQKIYQKIVEEKRGGFCYELNGLFYLLLKEVGFEIKRISARVYGDNGVLGPEFDHLCMLCKLENEEYLVDVGNGSFSLHPLTFVLEQEQEDPHGKFKISRYDEANYLVSCFKKETWTPDYLFKVQERAYEEFAEMCVYHQTSPHSPFTNKRMCTQAIPQGRITFLNDKLSIRKLEGKEEIPIADDADFKKKLKQYLEMEVQ